MSTSTFFVEGFHDLETSNPDYLGWVNMWTEKDGKRWYLTKDGPKHIGNSRLTVDHEWTREIYFKRISGIITSASKII